MIATKKPSYSDDRRLDMTAYIGPRRAGKRYFNAKYGENSRDTKEGYPSFIRDDVFELYKAAGLDFLIPEADAFFGQNITREGYVEEPDFEKSDLYTYMQMAEKHGLGVYPTMEVLFGPMTHQDGPFGEEEKALLHNFVETVQMYFPECFKGIMLTDEPSYPALDRVKKIVNYLHSEEIVSIKPDISIFASMLPMYGYLKSYSPAYTSEEYNQKVEFNEDRVRAYQYYVDLCADAIGGFCFDYYSLGCDGWLSEAFYQNLEIAAEHGKKGNYPIAVTVSSCRMDTAYNPKTGRGRNIYRIPSYEDMRFQVYSALAFGVQTIGYYTFWQHYYEGDGGVYPKAMVIYEPSEEKGYRKTEIYDAVKEVNEEVLTIDHIFLRFRWQGCRVVRTSRDRNIRHVKGGYRGGCLGEMKATRDLLVGCFENPEDGTEGYWIVNAQNPYRYEVNDVELHFKGAERLLYYRKGREYDVLLEDGRFAVRLGVGEGIFAIPYIT